MSANVEQPNKGLDVFKWIITIAILAGVVIANNLYDQESMLVRAVAAVVAIAIAAFIAASTTKGKTFLGFAKESRVEVRKVVWPTRQETTQTTLIIFAATALIAVLLYFLDMFLRWGVNFLTGVGA
jgi:preprotein translocase subunit SecE